MFLHRRFYSSACPLQCLNERFDEKTNPCVHGFITKVEGGELEERTEEFHVGNEDKLLTLLLLLQLSWQKLLAVAAFSPSSAPTSSAADNQDDDDDDDDDDES